MIGATRVTRSPGFGSILPEARLFETIFLATGSIWSVTMPSAVVLGAAWAISVPVLGTVTPFSSTSQWLCPPMMTSIPGTSRADHHVVVLSDVVHENQRVRPREGPVEALADPPRALHLAAHHEAVEQARAP